MFVWRYFSWFFIDYIQCSLVDKLIMVSFLILVLLLDTEETILYTLHIDLFTLIIRPIIGSFHNWFKIPYNWWLLNRLRNRIYLSLHLTFFFKTVIGLINFIRFENNSPNNFSSFTLHIWSYCLLNKNWDFTFPVFSYTIK